MMQRRFPLALLGMCLALTSAVHAQEKSVRPGINDPFKDPDLKKFLGIFEGESREIFTHREKIATACGLKPNMAVADIGAGTGLFTRHFAGQVGAKGKVYAVDIADRFLEHINKTCKQAGLDNVTTVKCTQLSVELPENSIDVAFVCDTYHHFEFPFRTLESIHRALKPGGRLVIVDFMRIPGQSRAWVLEHVRAGQDVVVREIHSCGFKQIEEHKFLKENYLVVFQKTPSLQPQAGKVQSAVYRSLKDVDLKMDIHFPPDWKAGDRRPGIVFFFGGGWNQGKLTQFERQAEYLASRGLVAARADYRVKARHNVTPVECVADARCAVHWLRANARLLGIDPDRIIAAGGSAGGHIAACTAIPLRSELLPPGLDPGISCRPNALVLFNPVLKFEGVPSLESRLPDAKLARDLSPTLHVDKNWPPAILFYGKEDKLLAQGEEYVAHAKKAGARAEMMRADGVAHGFFNKTPWTERTLNRADEFLQALGYVKGKATLKVP